MRTRKYRLKTNTNEAIFVGFIAEEIAGLSVVFFLTWFGSPNKSSCSSSVSLLHCCSSMDLNQFLSFEK